MLEKTLIFIAFLCPLIFFHELGHFFFARLFGVRVEVFSIGFGPKIAKFVRGGTEYAVSIIPLGGYVKMFGDDPFSEAELSEEEKKVAFNHKSKFARFWIVFGGPLANLILAFVLYSTLLTVGEKVPETKIGLVTQKSVLFEKGFRTGDVLVGINDEKILSFDDFNIKDSEVASATVRRKGEEKVLSVNMPLEPFVTEFVNIVSVVKKPIFVNGSGEKYFASLEEQPSDFSVSLEELSDSYSGVARVFPVESLEGEVKLKSGHEEIVGDSGNLITDLRKRGFYPVDLSISNVVMSSAADKAGFKMGDVLLSLNGKELSSFEELRQATQALGENEEVTVELLRGNEQITSKLTPEVKEENGRKVKLMGIMSAVEYVEPKLIVAKADSFPEAIGTAFTRTWDGIVKTFSGYKKLITREVSLNNIGGPLAIGKVASDSLNISLSMFFRLMAIISINLAVINLFPIPVLDGGHIMFLLFEAVNGGPLSRRKLEIAQRFGVSVLFFLIFIAIFNDISRLF